MLRREFTAPEKKLTVDFLSPHRRRRRHHRVLPCTGFGTSTDANVFPMFILKVESTTNRDYLKQPKQVIGGTMKSIAGARPAEQICRITNPCSQDQRIEERHLRRVLSSTSEHIKHYAQTNI